MSKLNKLLQNAKGDPILSMGYSLPHGTQEEYNETLKELVELTKKEQNYETQKEITMKAFEIAFWSFPRGKKKFHPSEISKGDYCKRKLYFDKLGFEDDNPLAKRVDAQLQRIFDVGTMLHLYMQWNLINNDLISDFETRVRSKALNVSGLADGQDDEHIIEIKTSNSFVFQKLKRANPMHVNQASIYGAGLGKKKIKFIYYDKNTSDVKVFVEDINTEFVKEFRAVVKELNELDRLNQSREEMEYPKRICGNRLEKKAMECPYANKCFEL